MTTIAFDGKTLAADTAMEFDGIKVRFTGKLRRFASGCLAGFAGDVPSGIKLLDWLESDDLNAKLELDADVDVGAILVTPDGGLTLYGGDGVEIPLEGPYATLGSGAALALGVLIAGKSAVDAVQAAIERDPNSGFEVISLSL